MTFLFASQIEDAAVSLLWHEPERLAGFLRDMDPAIHLTQPALRHILEAITLVYSDLATTDFELIVQILRELHRFDEVGGFEGLNRIYVLKQSRADKQTTNAVFGEYIRLLKAYAEHRNQDAPTMPYRFNRGEFYLIENKNNTCRSRPDYLGTGKIAGKTYSATGRRSKDGILVSLFPK